MKYIFLDIDGVLNSDDWDNSEEFKKESAGMPSALIIMVNHYLHLDPKAVKLINDLVDRSGAEVVLSSTWRIKYSPEEVTKMLQGRGATFTIKTCTPRVYGKFSERIPRGKEIAKYISDLQAAPESFVIIDDIDDMIHLKKHLVLTDVKTGITMADVEKCLKILNKE